MNDIKEKIGIYNYFFENQECSKCGHETKWLHDGLNYCSDCTVKHFDSE